MKIREIMKIKMKIRLPKKYYYSAVFFILFLFSIFFLSACANKQTTPSKPALAQADIASLSTALNYEYKALALYQTSYGKFLENSPFYIIAREQQQHVDEIVILYNYFGIKIPPDSWSLYKNEYNSISEACGAAAELEMKNIVLYDELIPAISNENIRLVFSNLRNASESVHLPIFQACARG